MPTVGRHSSGRGARPGSTTGGTYMPKHGKKYLEAGKKIDSDKLYALTKR